MKLIHGDCFERLREIPENSIDAVVTDPPYGISFMGKAWDYEVPKVELWQEVLRVLKPGGHALIACGTRTQHRMTVNVEDAGFEIRDVITWLYGQGFPKSLDISKAIDKAAGAEREKLGTKSTYRKPQISPNGNICLKREPFETAPTTEEAKQWEGWGTALKPACEFWTLARKPISEKTVAANVLKWGTGGINIDGCRVGSETITQHKRDLRNKSGNRLGAGVKQPVLGVSSTTTGRFPANLVLSHSPHCTDEMCDIECAVAMLDAQSGVSKSSAAQRKNNPSHNLAMRGSNLGHISFGHSDYGGASRFFYCAKISTNERNAGLDDMPSKEWKEQGYRDNETTHLSPRAGAGRTRANQNHHPTVKPIKLMEYLCRLITPENGTVLDPFMGSGSTGIAAKKLGFQFVGIEKNFEYFEISKMRINNAG